MHAGGPRASPCRWRPPARTDLRRERRPIPTRDPTPARRNGALCGVSLCCALIRGPDAQFASRIGKAWTAITHWARRSWHPEEAFLRDEERRRGVDQERVGYKNPARRALDALLRRQVARRPLICRRAEFIHADHDLWLAADNTAVRIARSAHIAFTS